VASLLHETLTGVTEGRLLQSVVAVARHIYQAAASSVFMVSPDNGDLIFAAVAGEGEESLIGKRFSPGTGIAGWVAASCETLIVDDVTKADRFAKDAAASTGYLPGSIMAAPLVVDGECIGVLEVLDRHTTGSLDPGRALDDMELLGLLARQAALSLALVRRSERNVPAVPHIGSLLARLTEHAAIDSYDPLAAALLGLSLDLLDRSCPSSP